MVKKFITPIVFFLLISISPLNAQDKSPDRWQEVERWFGTITYEYKGTDVPIGGMPGTASQTITYNVVLDREDDRTWRGNAEGHGSTEAYAEQITGRSQHTISSSGRGSLEDQAYLTLNYRRGHYTIGITGRPGPITVQHQERWTMVGETLKDIDVTLETTLMRISSGAPFRETPQLPESGMVLSGTLEFNFHWESHKLTWSLKPADERPHPCDDTDIREGIVLPEAEMLRESIAAALSGLQFY